MLTAGLQSLCQELQARLGASEEYERLRKILKNRKKCSEKKRERVQNYSSRRCNKPGVSPALFGREFPYLPTFFQYFRDIRAHHNTLLIPNAHANTTIWRQMLFDRKAIATAVAVGCRQRLLARK